MAIELDFDDDFSAVLARAVRNFPAIWDHLHHLRPAPCCHRVLASHRLWVRRWAARGPRPGEAWYSWELLPLIDEELDRQGITGEERNGCTCSACPACHPAPACGCSGGSCSTSG